MSKKKRRVKGKQQPGGASSLVIPVVVGIVVVAIIVAAIVSLEKRQSIAAQANPTLSVPVVTAAPLPTTEIPYPTVERISVKDAVEQLGNGQAILIDVRSKAAYDESHAVGATSLPQEELVARVNELPRDKLLVLYCT